MAGWTVPSEVLGSSASLIKLAFVVNAPNFDATWL
jgi:hypothetical protein